MFKTYARSARTSHLSFQDDIEIQERAYSDKLCVLKTALMQDLLTGKKRVLSLLETEGLES